MAGHSADLWQLYENKAIGRPKVFNGTDASNLTANKHAREFRMRTPSVNTHRHSLLMMWSCVCLHTIFLACYLSLSLTKVDRDARETLIETFNQHIKEEHRDASRLFNYPQQGKVDVAKITLHGRLCMCVRLLEPLLVVLVCLNMRCVTSHGVRVRNYLLAHLRVG